MMYLKKPAEFNPKFEITSCFLEKDDKFLLLHRCEHKAEGNTWGAPAGKIEEGESLIEATIREIFEETGIKLSEKNLNYWGKTFVKYEKYDFVYHMHSAKVPKNAIIKINTKEHKDFKWVTPLEGLALPLIQDEENSIKIFYKLV